MNRRTFVKTLPALTVLASSASALAQDSAEPAKALEPFTLPKPELDEVFLKEAKKAGLVTLKGHRSVGGMRASIYNALPEAGVDALIAFMKDFAQRNA